MSEQKTLKEKMLPQKQEQRVEDRIAETLNLIHDEPPLQPTKKYLSYQISGKTYDEKKDAERDISMLTNIPPELVFLNAFERALAVTEPCIARTAFMEEINRASRSKKGWWGERTEAFLKAVRRESDTEVQRGRMRRFTDWLKGR